MDVSSIITRIQGTLEGPLFDIFEFNYLKSFSLNKEASDVGTGVVGAPACGDVMKLQIQVLRHQNILTSIQHFPRLIQKLVGLSRPNSRLSVVDLPLLVAHMRQR